MRGHWIGGTRKLNHHWQSGKKSERRILATLLLPLHAIVIAPDMQTKSLHIELPIWNQVKGYGFFINEDTSSGSDTGKNWGASYKNSIGALSNAGNFDSTDIRVDSSIYYSKSLSQTLIGEGIPLYYNETYYSIETVNSRKNMTADDISNLKKMLTMDNSVPIIEWKGTEGTAGEGGYTILASQFEMGIDGVYRAKLLPSIHNSEYSYNWFGITIPLTWTVPLADEQTAQTPLAGKVEIYG